MKFAHLLLLLLALSCASCSNDPRSRAESQLRRVGVDLIRQDAALLYKQQFATRTLDYIALRPNKWPDSFRKFKPLGVGLYLDGVTISIDTRSSGETGLYIIPRSMEQMPKNTPTSTYERVTDGVYWYTFRN